MLHVQQDTAANHDAAVSSTVAATAGSSERNAVTPALVVVHLRTSGDGFGLTERRVGFMALPNADSAKVS